MSIMPTGLVKVTALRDVINPKNSAEFTIHVFRRTIIKIAPQVVHYFRHDDISRLARFLESQPVNSKVTPSAYQVICKPIDSISSRFNSFWG